jgi:phospholipid/cholesterol/gamma-HCH transport system permease protein
VELRDRDGAPRQLAFDGELRFQACQRAWAEVRQLAEGGAEQPLQLDLARVRGLDGGSAALLIDLVSDLRQGGRTVELVGARDNVSALLELYGAHPQRPPEKAAPCGRGALDQMGATVVELLRRLQGSADVLGQFVAELRLVLREPRIVPWRHVARLCERHGADAVPIVAVIQLLVGMILAFQAAGQLERFGAEVFVANLVGLSVVRELGPLMTAILVAGRSGAAFAAELGTMKVGEELDALRTLGVSPHSYLVLPRFLALLVCLPALTLGADVCGVVGGLVIGVFELDLTAVSYWNQTRSALGLVDVLGGLFKSVVFAALVAAVACERGLSTRGASEGVGRSTTSAVVTTIFLLVVSDAVLTWLYRLYDL